MTQLSKPLLPLVKENLSEESHGAAVSPQGETQHPRCISSDKSNSVTSSGPTESSISSKSTQSPPGDSGSVVSPTTLVAIAENETTVSADQKGGELDSTERTNPFLVAGVVCTPGFGVVSGVLTHAILPGVAIAITSFLFFTWIALEYELERKLSAKEEMTKARWARIYGKMPRDRLRAVIERIRGKYPDEVYSYMEKNMMPPNMKQLSDELRKNE